jgi:hypothetical protein
VTTGRFLVVEGDTAIRGHLTRLLSPAGSHPTPVGTAADAAPAIILLAGDGDETTAVAP